MKDWRDSALCAQVDPELFFPESTDRGEAAKKVCGRCPVRVECLEHALTISPAPAGIWGGVAERARSRFAA